MFKTISENQYFMEKKLHAYNPEFEYFVFRAFGDFSIFLAVIAFVFWNVFSIPMHVNWLIILIIDIILAFSFIRIPINYIYYLGSLTISEEDKTVNFELYKFDKLIKNEEIKIENIDVKIVDHIFYRESIFELRIYSNGKCICKQRMTRNWKVNDFMEIKAIIVAIKTGVNLNSIV